MLRELTPSSLKAHSQEQCRFIIWDFIFWSPVFEDIIGDAGFVSLDVLRLCGNWWRHSSVTGYRTTGDITGPSIRGVFWDKLRILECVWKSYPW